MIGQKFTQFIVMELNISEAGLSQYHTKTKSYISEELIMYFNK